MRIAVGAIVNGPSAARVTEDLRAAEPTAPGDRLYVIEHFDPGFVVPAEGLVGAWRISDEALLFEVVTHAVARDETPVLDECERIVVYSTVERPAATLGAPSDRSTGFALGV